MNASLFHNAIRIGQPIVLMIALLCSLPALSAPPGPDGNRGHLNRLVHNPVVTEHLGLTAEQAEASQQASNAAVEAHRADFVEALAPATKKERVPLVAKVFVSVNRATFERLEDIISDAQLKRLEQIEIQTFGVRALARPATVEQLGLEPSQVKEMRSIGNNAGKQLSALHQSEDLDRAEKKDKARGIQRQAMDDVRQALSAEQWVKWELLTGAPFSL